MSILTYESFIKRVETLGFMPFSTIIPGWTSLNDETPDQWHTGDPDTDPWQWKDRAASEKRLAFGCIFNGHKGFISKEWYPFFCAAYNPEESIDDRWEDGKVNQNVLKVWSLFKEGSSLSTDDIRNALGVGKKGGSQIDSAIKTLQKEYYITVSGNRRKINRLGEPYGWPSNTYERVIDWAPGEWLKKVNSIKRNDARNRIINAICEQCKIPDIKKISKTLGL